MQRPPTFWGAVVLGAMLPPSLAANDRVDDLRRAADRPWTPPAAAAAPEKAASPPPRRRSAEEDADRDDDVENELFADLFWAGAAVTGMALSSPVWVPATLVDDGAMRRGWFTRYPYQFHDGFMTFEHPSDGDDEPWEPALWSLRIETDYGTDFGDQQLIGGHVLWEHHLRLGLEARLNYLEDHLAGRRDDGLYFGDVNGTFRFAQSRHWLFRGGLGANWLADRGRQDLGFNATYQIDWFPTEPLVFSTDFDVGTLGDAWLFHFQQTAGVTWRGIEARIGFDYLDVGDAQFSLLLCGVRAWF